MSKRGFSFSRAARNRSAADIAADFSRDKRTIGTTQAAAWKLKTIARDGEVAAELGISRQKYTAIYKKIQAGEIYSPEIRDRLNKIADQKWERLEINRPEEFKLRYHGEEYEGEIYSGDHPGIKSIHWKKEVKRYSGPHAKKMAEKWWAGIGGGMEYFKIVKVKSKKTGRDQYVIYETRSKKELNKKGSNRGEITAKRILNKYRK